MATWFGRIRMLWTRIVGRRTAIQQPVVVEPQAAEEPQAEPELPLQAEEPQAVEPPVAAEPQVAEPQGKEPQAEEPLAAEAVEEPSSQAAEPQVAESHVSAEGASPELKQAAILIHPPAAAEQQRSEGMQANRLGVGGVDVGFSDVKFVWSVLGSTDTKIKFPSVVGSVTAGSYSFAQGSRRDVIRFNGTEFLVGSGAFLSKFVTDRRDPSWVTTDVWKALFYSALAHTPEDMRKMVLVTGLPISDYQSYVDALGAVLLKTHQFTFNGRAREIEVVDYRILTQPYGTYLADILSLDGKSLSKPVNGLVLVVDLGGNTMNLLTIDVADHSEIPEWSVGDGIGLLRAMDNMASAIRTDHKGFQAKAHEVPDWLNSGEFSVRGAAFSIQPYVEQFLYPIAQDVVSRVAAVVTEPGRLSRVYLTGGGALALGRLVQRQLDTLGFPGCVICDEYRNADGYRRLASAVANG